MLARLPDRAGPFRGSAPELATLLARLEDSIHRWAQWLCGAAHPRWHIVGAGIPVVEEYSARRWECVLTDPAAGGFVVHLPDPDPAHAGDEILILRTSSSTNTVTVQCRGDYLRGASTFAITSAWRHRRFIDSGDQWLVGEA